MPAHYRKVLLSRAVVLFGGKIGIWKQARGLVFMSSYPRSNLSWPVRIGDERGRLVTASPVMTKIRAPAGRNNYLESGLVKPPRGDTRALSPAGIFGGKAPFHLAAQKSRLRAPPVPMRSAPAYFLCKWGL
jgi:hypothetical protein